MKVFITGINGFIGSHLAEAILRETGWEVSGLDLASGNINELLKEERFTAFRRGDVFKDGRRIEEQVEWCDVAVPLAGVARPAIYLKKPVWTYELDFEQNLRVVRMCSLYGKRLIFPSTSEVYGLCGDGELKEDESPLVTGPIGKMRWIYSCSKQMLDRMIFAYRQEHGLNFSIFRPFNWVGPRLDTFEDAKKREARAVTQMIYDVLHRGEVSLVGGGHQRRSFTWIGDAIEGLLAVIRNDGGKASGEIFNIGNPSNNCSLLEFARMLVEEMEKFPAFAERAKAARLLDVGAAEHYGDTYDDTDNRVPSVEKIGKRLGWHPRTPLRDMLRMTLEWYARGAEGL